MPAPSKTPSAKDDLPSAEQSETDHPQGGPPGHEPPQQPDPEDYPPVLEAPTAVDADAVETVATSEGRKKFGWQSPAKNDFTPKEPCVHMGIVQAKKQISNHELGHEWVCTCGEIFVVVLNSGGKKTLTPKGNAVPIQLPVEPEGD